MPPKVKDNLVISDVEKDVIKMAVVDRNTDSGRVGIGFVQGIGLTRGAIASSVAHDAHNFGVIGTNDDDMVSALRELRRLGGGFVSVLDGKVLSSLPLPVGGLMSQESPEEIMGQYERMEVSVEKLGCSLEHPFMVMAFLSLSVIPTLKLTDQGYVDLGAGGLLDLFV
jgi:adenine deaminase